MKCLEKCGALATEVADSRARGSFVSPPQEAHRTQPELDAEARQTKQIELSKRERRCDNETTV